LSPIPDRINCAFSALLNLSAHYLCALRRIVHSERHSMSPAAKSQLKQHAYNTRRSDKKRSWGLHHSILGLSSPNPRTLHPIPLLKAIFRACGTSSTGGWGLHLDTILLPCVWSDPLDLQQRALELTRLSGSACELEVLFQSCLEANRARSLQWFM
jgi:hypothetical protein